METRSPGPQEALEALQRELSARQSVLHFAHAAIATILGLISAGAAAKLFWDLTLERAHLALPVAGLSAALFIYASARYLIGRSALKQELASFAQLQTLRKQLNLEDNSRLLPR